jgi:hypothetical protein
LEIALNHSVTVPLRRPLPGRWAQDVVRFIVRAWQQHRATRDHDRRIEAMADLSVAVLRDIGGSEDLLNQAAARHQSHAQCLEELRILANYRGVDLRFW